MEETAGKSSDELIGVTFCDSLMKETPIAVAIAALVRDNRLLLIRRVKGDYVGLLGLPGGKIEKDEHVSESAAREVFEESGIRSVFREYLGFVSEQLVEDGAIVKHILLHVCALEPESTDITNGSEGVLEWYDLDSLEGMRASIIPSDFLMIEYLVKKRGKQYYDCVIEKRGEDHLLRKFV